ncbi:MAG: hypothetical protein ACPG19_14385 [Saprospiraceae bacterium]
MRKLNYYWIILSSIFIISSCDLSESVTLDELERYPVYFQYEYINYAWVKNHYGWFIDNQGNVMGYNQPDQWNSGSNEGLYAENDLLSNLALVDTLLYTVNIEELQQQVAHISAAHKGTLSDQENTAQDMGTNTLYAFAWDEDKQEYERILIKSTGDWSQENNNSEAKKIFNWLNSVGKEIYQNDDWFKI